MDPGWLQRRPRAVAHRDPHGAIVLLTLFLVWLILFITKGRFLKGPFEQHRQQHDRARGAASAGDFQLYFAPIDIKFLAEG